MNQISVVDKIEIPKNEYAVLKTLVKEYKKHAHFFRILEAEENLRKGKVKRMSSGAFIRSLSK